MRQAAAPLSPKDERVARRLAPQDERVARRLAAACAALVALTTALIVLGALVRAHGAGLACPDWPLCFGEVVPAMDLKVAFEWSHRVTAGTVSLAFVTISALALRSAALRGAALPYVLTGGALLALQIVLGALTVWQLLAAWTVTSHLVVGNSFNVCLLLFALRLRDCTRAASGAPRAAAAGTGLRWWIGIAALLLFIQIVIGGLVSSTFAGMACPEFPTCNGGVWFPAWTGAVGLHVHHRVNGVMLLGVLAVVAWLGRRTPRVGRLAALTLILCLAQATVGVSNVLLGIPVEVTGLHSLGAAILILTTAVLVREGFTRSVPG